MLTRGSDSLRSAGAESKPLSMRLVRFRSGVTILQHGVGREMQVGRAEGTKRGHPSQELNGLQFAAEAQLQNVPQREFHPTRKAPVPAARCRGH